MNKIKFTTPKVILTVSKKIAEGHGYREDEWDSIPPRRKDQYILDARVAIETLQELGFREPEEKPE